MLERAAASNQTEGFFGQPVPWLTAALKNHFFFVANSGNIRVAS